MDSGRSALPLEGLRVLGITPTPTHPTVAGNRARCRALLDRLESLGATIRLVHVGHEAGDLTAMHAHWSGGAVGLPFSYPPPRHARWNKFARRCRDHLRLPVPDREDVDDWCDPANAAPLRREVDEFRPHAVLMVYFWNSRLLDGLPSNVLRVLDAQDVFTDRNARMRAARIPMQWFSVPRHEEQRGLDRFDVVLAIQENEAAFYRSLTRRPVVTVGHLLPIIDAGPPSRSPRLLVVGSDNPINVDGVNWFVRDVWPRVLAARPDAWLRVVGRVCAHVPPAPNVTLEGTLDDLLGAYTGAALVVSPLRGGTGLKIKAVEALAAGRVVISTPSAAEGLEAAEGNGLIVTGDEEAMASAVEGLLSDPDRLASLSAAAAAFAGAWNDRYAAAFDDIFKPLVSADTGFPLDAPAASPRT
jgi:glycosyltransferase involved in cell wall biosynthesis